MVCNILKCALFVDSYREDTNNHHLAIDIPGLPEDVWFHVDDLSSAHVYLRMKPGMTMDDISEQLILECSSLVKANSIQGCKVREIENEKAEKHDTRLFVINLTHFAFFDYLTFPRKVKFMSYTHGGRI